MHEAEGTRWIVTAIESQFHASRQGIEWLPNAILVFTPVSKPSTSYPNETPYWKAINLSEPSGCVYPMMDADSDLLNYSSKFWTGSKLK